MSWYYGLAIFAGLCFLFYCGWFVVLLWKEHGRIRVLRSKLRSQLLDIEERKKRPRV